MAMLVLALLEDHERHGYEIARLIEQRSDSALQFHAASLYPLLYRLEKRGLVQGKWVEKGGGERRRRYYRITAGGRRELSSLRRAWRSLFEALDRVARFGHA